MDTGKDNFNKQREEILKLFKDSWNNGFREALEISMLSFQQILEEGNRSLKLKDIIIILESLKK